LLETVRREKLMKYIIVCILTIILCAGACLAAEGFAPTRDQRHGAVCLNALFAHFEAQEMIDSWDLELDMPDYWPARKAEAEQAIRKHCKGVRGQIQPPVVTTTEQSQ
jgi:hypothetical protein